MPLPTSAVTLVVTPSRWSAAGFETEGFPASRIEVVGHTAAHVPCAREGDLTSRAAGAQVPHGVDTTLFYPPTSPEAKAASRAALFGWGRHDVVLLFVGAITPQKGVPELLGAFARLLESRDLDTLRRADGHAPVVRLVLKGNEALYKGSKHLHTVLARLPSHVTAAVQVGARGPRIVICRHVHMQAAPPSIVTASAKIAHTPTTVPYSTCLTHCRSRRWAICTALWTCLSHRTRWRCVVTSAAPA